MESPTLADILPPENLRALAEAWLREDAPSIDVGGALVGNRDVKATLFLKSSAVLAGRPFFEAIFHSLDCKVVWRPDYQEGAYRHVTTDKVSLATVSGPARRLLLGERPALNAFAECCSVATAARSAADVAARVEAWKGCVAGTRKTAPGLRLLQKYAMAVGGMDMHRMDLSGMVMVKDNHSFVSGGVGCAVRNARQLCGFSVKIDAECASVDDAFKAAEAGADVVMLDNFKVEEFVAAVRKFKKRFPNVLVEASGGITLETLEGYMVEGADVISFSVNRYAKAVDVSLKID